MKVAKKKNLQKGEEIISNPGVHWIKVVDPLAVLTVTGILYLVEALSGLSYEIPSSITAALLTALSLYFFLQVGESLNHGSFITNKLLAALIILCPLFLANLVFGSMPFFAEISWRIGANARYVLLTLLILEAVHLFLQIVEYMNTEYHITNKRILIKRGFFSQRVMDIAIDKIETLALIQGFWGGVFNYGSICVTGTGGRCSALNVVSKPFAVRRAIDTIIEKNRAITIIHDESGIPPVDELSLEGGTTRPSKAPGEDLPEMFKYGTLIRVISPDRITY